MNLLLYFLFYMLFNYKNVISTCPRECECKNLDKYVKCKHKGLKTIPVDIPTSVEILDLLKNDFQNISSKAFIYLTNLRDLRLNHCQIKKLDKNCFDGLTKLKNLYLTNNYIDNLEQDVFKGLHNLQHLYLSNNQFQTVPLVESASVTRLNLDGNKISSALIPDSFNHNVDLKTLILTNNLINSLLESDLVNLAKITLQTLTLKMNNIGNIHPNAFKPIKDSLINLNLDGNPLLTSSHVENSFSVFTGVSQFISINLRRTGLTNISQTFFKPFRASKLQRINIGDNSHLSFIDIDAFMELNNVLDFKADKCRITSLDIKFNSMNVLQQMHLDHNKFVKCPHLLPTSLKILDLSHNEIKLIIATDLKGLIHLTSLNLANNYITSISENSFSDLITLFSLDLSHNKLQTIQPHIFSSMSALIYLDLHQQDPCLKHLSAESFHLSNLLTLTLSENCVDISTSDYSPFNGCPRLTHLWLVGNTMEFLGEQIFTGCHNLSYLYLSHNKIKGWSTRTFVSVSSTLVTIDLSSNQLRFVSTMATDKNYLPMVFGKLQNVSLENNHWECTCKSVKWMLEHKDFLHNSERILCSDPIDGSLKKLLDMTNNNECDIQPVKQGQVIKLRTNSTKIIGIVVSILITTGLTILIFIIRKRLRRFTRRIFRNARHNPYHRLQGSIGSDHNLLNNPLIDDDVQIISNNRLVINESILERPDICVQESEDDNVFRRLTTSHYDSDNEDIVLVSTSSCVTDKYRVKMIDNCEDFENRLATFHCKKLVLDYPFLENKDLKRLVEFRQRSQRDTYVFHPEEFEFEEENKNEIWQLVGPKNIRMYHSGDIANEFYSLY